jgi:Tfp pilus assembly protein PilO
MPQTRSSRWALMTSALCLVLLVGTWLLLIAPRRSQAAELQGQQVTTQQHNDELTARIADLRSQYGQLPAKRAELAAVLQQIPSVADVPQLVREINTMAEASGVTVDAITRSPAATVTASAAKADPTTAGLVQIPLTMTLHGDYFQAMAFLQKLQTQLPRALLISGVQVAQNTSGSTKDQIQLSLTGAVYVWPNAPTPSATGASSTATASGSGVTATTAPAATSSSTAKTGGAP